MITKNDDQLREVQASSIDLSGTSIDTGDDIGFCKYLPEHVDPSTGRICGRIIAAIQDAFEQNVKLAR